MAKRPDVSIIIPAYNEEKYIGAALSSIRRQKTKLAYEIIVGDGMCTDNTPKIAKDYGAMVVEEGFGTPSGGRHAAAKKAKGRLFFFVSADVELCPGWLDGMQVGMRSAPPLPHPLPWPSLTVQHPSLEPAHEAVDGEVPVGWLVA